MRELRRGEHHNKVMQEDYDVYGADAFVFSVIVSGDLSSEDMDRIETEEIDKLGGVDGGVCYNVFTGGHLGSTVNQAFRDRASQINKGKKFTTEHRARQAEATRKQWQNQEYRQRMVESAKKQWESEEYREIMFDAHYGKTKSGKPVLTEETVRVARERFQHGEDPRDLAKEYGLTNLAMSQALRGVTWKNVQ